MKVAVVPTTLVRLRGWVVMTGWPKPVLTTARTIPATIKLNLVFLVFTFSTFRHFAFRFSFGLQTTDPFGRVSRMGCRKYLSSCCSRSGQPSPERGAESQICQCPYRLNGPNRRV